MFAVAVLAPHVVLPALGVIAAVSACVFIVTLVKNHKPTSSVGLLGTNELPSLFTHLDGWSHSPEMQLIGRALMLRLKEFGDKTGHALLDGVLLKVLPGSAPFLPTINTVVSDLESKLIPNAASAPTSPSGSPLPQSDGGHTLLRLPKVNHPLVQLLVDVAERYQQQEKQSQVTKKN